VGFYGKKGKVYGNKWGYKYLVKSYGYLQGFYGKKGKVYGNK
jgi:hypothetical protein